MKVGLTDGKRVVALMAVLLVFSCGNPGSTGIVPMDKTPVDEPVILPKLSVKDFGAKGDGIARDTEAIQSAIDHASDIGGGMVILPEGTYLCGSIWLKDHVELHLSEGAVIQGSPDIKDYCAADCCPQNEAEIGWGDYVSGGHLLLGVGVQNVTLSGSGKIDGNSDAFLLDANGKPYKEKSQVPFRPSQMVWFVDSRDITIKDVELAHSPYWSCFILNCENVSISGCYVHTQRSEYHTFNGDGIDIDRSRNVTIKNCRIDTADDCLTLRASSAHLLAKPMDCSDITVSACSLSSDCNAVRVGVGEGFIHDAVFSDINISNSNVAFNIVAAYVKGSKGTDVARIHFRDIRLQAKEFLRIHHMYSKSAQIYDITFDSVEGVAPDCSHIWAKTAAPFSNILLRKVFVPAEFECMNATVLVEGGQIKKKKLSQDEAKRLGDAIENETQLLY